MVPTGVETTAPLVARLLFGGVVACSAIANPHDWLEVVGPGDTWIPLDPSLPCIARMLGLDWQPWVDAYCGGCDAGRILIARHRVGDDPWWLDETVVAAHGAFVHPTPGELFVRQDGTWRSAWACQDWSCGWCHDQFEAIT